MKNEMVERVAKAINEIIYIGDSGAKQLARAAIEAMREPTDEMICECNSSLVYEELKLIYKSMIDVALKE
jgi:hypothetical protein